MKDLLIPILTFVFVIAVGGAVLVIRGARRRRLEERLYGGGASSGAGHGGYIPPPLPGERRGLVGVAEQVGKAVTAGQPVATDLRSRLAQAGFYDEAFPTIYVGAQLSLVLLGIPLGGFLAFSFELSLLARCAIIFGLVAFLALLPNIFVALRRRRRTAEVRRNLPDAIDLLEICVSSGMGLDMAWNSVTDEIRNVSLTLGDEMALASLEMHLGALRADALRHMAQRTGVDDVSSLVATLVQSERFGTSIAQALRAYADDMRTDRSQRAEEQAEKLAVKLLFPMVMFIFPCMLVVILGPAVIKIAAVFQAG